MKNIWRKLFKKNRPLTNQHGPAKKVSPIASSISRDDKGRWTLDKKETSFDKFIAEALQELADEGKRIKANPVPKPKAKTAPKTKKVVPSETKPTVKKAPASGTKAVSKAKVAKPATAKPTPKKPKSK